MKKLLVLTLFAVLPTAAGAQAWSMAPDGTLQYSTDYQTSGFFFCNPSNLPYVFGGCTASGNTLTLTSGAATLTTTYIATGGPVVATNLANQFVDAGRFETVLSGEGPFVIPMLAGPQVQPLFVFTLGISSTLLPAQGNFARGFIRTGDSQIIANCCEGSNSYATFPVTSPPSGYVNSPVALEYSNLTQKFIRGETSTQNLQLTLGIVPEPSSLALLTTGIFALWVTTRNCRAKRQRDQCVLLE